MHPALMLLLTTVSSVHHQISVKNFTAQLRGWICLDMTSPACCKAGPPVVSNYVAQGDTQMLGDMEVYTINEGKGPAIIVIYDIFGFSPQLQQASEIRPLTIQHATRPKTDNRSIIALCTYKFVHLHAQAAV